MSKNYGDTYYQGNNNKNENKEELYYNPDYDFKFNKSVSLFYNRDSGRTTSIHHTIGGFPVIKFNTQFKVPGPGETNYYLILPQEGEKSSKVSVF